LCPSKLPVVGSRWMRIEPKAVACAVDGFYCPPFVHPEIRKQRPTRGMIGVDPKTFFDFGHALGRFTFIGAQIAEHDMRVSMFRVEQPGLAGSRASQGAVVIRLATMRPAKVVAHREPGMGLREAGIEFYGLLKQWTRCLVGVERLEHQPSPTY